MFPQVLGGAWDFDTMNKCFPQQTKSDLKLWNWMSWNIDGLQRVHERRFPKSSPGYGYLMLIQALIFLYALNKLSRVSILKLIWKQITLSSQSHGSILPKLPLEYTCTDYRTVSQEGLVLLLNREESRRMKRHTAPTPPPRPPSDLVVDNAKDNCWAKK